MILWHNYDADLNEVHVELDEAVLQKVKTDAFGQGSANYQLWSSFLDDLTRQLASCVPERWMRVWGQLGKPATIACVASKRDPDGCRVLRLEQSC